MKEEVCFRCGHVQEVELPNGEKARLQMRQRMQQRGCRACGYQEKVEVAKQRATELGLIPLQGTRGQIAYGNLLRSRQVDLFLRTVELVQRADPEGVWAKFLHTQLLFTVNMLPDAVWWIEHQELKFLQSLLGEQWQEEQNDE